MVFACASENLLWKEESIQADCYGFELAGIAVLAALESRECMEAERVLRVVAILVFAVAAPEVLPRSFWGGLCPYLLSGETFGGGMCEVLGDAVLCRPRRAVGS